MNTPSKPRRLAIFTSLALAACALPQIYGQGPLTPPPGAPAPSMKTLQQVEPRTPISAVPFTISTPGSYYLTSNVTGAASVNGISIAADNVTLDLNGFSLEGVANSGFGIVASAARTNVTVQNGTVRGWGGTGVSFSALSGNVRVERLNVSNCGSYGIFVHGAVVSHCMVHSTTLDGIDATDSMVTDCLVSLGARNGIWCTNGEVRNCTVDSCIQHGIMVRPGTVSGCTVKRGRQIGIFVDLPGCQIIGNTVTGNNSVNNANYAGIYVNDANNRVENNHVIGNGASGSGILLSSIYAGNVIIRNTVSGNGARNYVTSALSIVGPIIGTAGTITSENPWANFSF